MKEIEFIPEWYKANQKRRRSYHRQYVLLVVLFAAMMGWSFVVGRHVERVRADVRDVQRMFEKGKLRVDEGLLLEAEIDSLKQQARVLEMTSPRTDVSAVIAELSYLVRDNIILSRVSLNNEAIEATDKQKTTSAAVVQFASTSEKKTGADEFLKQSRTCVTLTGIAAQPADVARLISQLEQSPYFEQESPVYSRSKTVKDHEVTEFEIRCTVADYKIRKQE